MLTTDLTDGVANHTGVERKFDVLAIDSALTQIKETDARLAQVVELRYFGGLTFTEIADLLGLAERTIRRDWEKAKLLLLLILREAKQRE